MQPAIDYEELIGRISDTFRYLYDTESESRVRMIGLVFARANSPLAKSEIIPQLNDWHYRSGKHIDFFFAGYTYPHPPVEDYISIEVPGQQDWLYSSKRFEAFRKEIEDRTTWQSSGASDLILTNAKYSISKSEAEIDFGTVVQCRLDQMKKDEAFPSIEEFFESIFRYAESANDLDPTWGFSNDRGISVAGSALKRVALSLLPKKIGEDIKKAEHYAVRDVGV